MSFRLKNRNPWTPIVTETRAKHVVTTIATPRFWTELILFFMVKLRTTRRTTDRTPQIQRRLWKTNMESHAQGRNRNNPIPVATPHNAMQTTRAPMIFSRSTTKPITPKSNANPLKPVTKPPTRFSCWEAFGWSLRRKLSAIDMKLLLRMRCWTDMSQECSQVVP